MHPAVAHARPLRAVAEIVEALAVKAMHLTKQFGNSTGYVAAAVLP